MDVYGLGREGDAAVAEEEGECEWEGEGECVCEGEGGGSVSKEMRRDSVRLGFASAKVG